MKKFDCSKFLDRCQAGCCGVFPIEKDLYVSHIDKIVNSTVEVDEYEAIDPISKDLKEYVMPLTKDMKCCFLQDDYKCSIYEDRPEVCKIFGDETVPILTCNFQDKDAKERSAQEQASLVNDLHNILLTYLKKEGFRGKL